MDFEGSNDTAISLLLLSAIRANDSASFARLTRLPRFVAIATANRDFSVLHECARRNRIAFAEFFLQRGIAMNCRDEHGDTPLKVALAAGHQEMVFCLSKYAPKPSVTPAPLKHLVVYHTPPTRRLPTCATLRIVGARGLRNARLLGRQMPFCAWILTNVGSGALATQAIVLRGRTRADPRNARNPDWSLDSFVLTVGGAHSKTTLATHILEFCVCTPTVLGLYETVGVGSWPLRELGMGTKPGVKVELHVPLRSKNWHAGVLTIELLC